MLGIKRSGELYVVELWCQLTPHPTSQGDGIVANNGIM